MVDEKITFPKACWICHRTEEDIREIMNSFPDEDDDDTYLKDIVFGRECFLSEFDKLDKNELLISADETPFYICPICEMFIGNKIFGFLFNCSDSVLAAVEEALYKRQNKKKLSNL